MNLLPPASDDVAARQAHPFATLTPDVVLDALSSVGLHGDGRLMALSVLRKPRLPGHAGRRHGAVVAKFYRPERWSEAQILEEHAFAAELMAAEVPAVAPLVLEGRTLHRMAALPSASAPGAAAARPSWTTFEVLEWIGRFLARIHTVGAARTLSPQRPALDVQAFATEPRDWLLAHEHDPAGCAIALGRPAKKLLI
jgi:Ser/Thr protein kinase RdoA (MazF antagonist)